MEAPWRVLARRWREDEGKRASGGAERASRERAAARERRGAARAY